MILWLTIVATLSGSWSSDTQWDALVLQAERKQAADDLRDAERLRWQALKRAQMQVGLEDPRLIPLVSRLAGVLHEEHRDAEAEPMVRTAVDIAYKSGDAKLIGIALSSLGAVLAGEGDRARAEPVFRRSLALLEKSEGVDALDTANAANNLAALYCDIGEYPEAEKGMNVALSFRRY